MDKDEIIEILKRAGLSPSEAAVYLALLGGIGSVQEIVKNAGEKRPTVYYSLNNLQKFGLVSKTGKDYGHKYQVESVNKLEALVRSNISKQEGLLEEVKALQAIYVSNKKTTKTIISHFDSTESIKVALFDSLYKRGSVIRSIVPGDNFFVEMGDKYIKEYVSQKVKRGIKTKALWEDIPNKKVLDEYYSESDIRQLPLDMHNSFKTAMFIYEDSVLYIGPKEENYALLIQSKEYTKLMKTIFENIWQGSTEIKRK